MVVKLKTKKPGLHQYGSFYLEIGAFRGPVSVLSEESRRASSEPSGYVSSVTFGGGGP